MSTIKKAILWVAYVICVIAINVGTYQTYDIVLIEAHYIKIGSQSYCDDCICAEIEITTENVVKSYALMGGYLIAIVLCNYIVYRVFKKFLNVPKGLLLLQMAISLLEYCYIDNIIALPICALILVTMLLYMYVYYTRKEDF
jgi:hypothetical protein